jgi:hypothetical protein
MTPILGQLQTTPPIKPAIVERDCSGLMGIMGIMGLKKSSPNDPTIATPLKI